MNKLIIVLTLLIFITLYLMPVEALGSAIGGWWDTSLLSNTSCTVTNYLWIPGHRGQLRLYYDGMPLGLFLRDDGAGGDLVAGDEIY